MKIITSPDNPEIKHVASLQHKKYRDKSHQFIAEGFRVCSTLIKSGMKLHTLYLTHETTDIGQSLTDEKNIKIVNQRIMQKISATTTPSGILGVFTIPQQPHPKTLSRGLVLAQIADPGNMGTLIRSCAAMNVRSVVIVEGVDPWSPKTIQATAGTIGLVDIFQLHWDELKKYKKSLTLCALVVTGGKQPHEIDFTNTLLVIGSEAHGIPLDWLEDCEEFLTIPITGKVESLNAAVAGSIALYLAFTPHTIG